MLVSKREMAPAAPSTIAAPVPPGPVSAPKYGEATPRLSNRMSPYARLRPELVSEVEHNLVGGGLRPRAARRLVERHLEVELRQQRAGRRVRERRRR